MMLKTNKNKYTVIALIFAVTFASIAATTPATQPKERNLKVLPKNISDDSLDHLMDYYKVALSVKCSFCHAKSLTKPKKNDFASDANPIKEITRKMILMTDEMNAKYVHTITHPANDSTALQIVTCNTCHRGKAKPDVADLVIK